ncbi:NOT4 [Malassezia furfur]|nr:NOT4 [Malassezia furfur]
MVRRTGTTGGHAPPPPVASDHGKHGQDTYWSDDGDENECPLCLEEIDISDANFKPCPCGYQICRFCWHHIKQNLNGRCPACRRKYSDQAIEFKAMSTEEILLLTNAKKNREREKKEMEATNRKHLSNMRVVQKNLVYVVGLSPKFAREEFIPTLKSADYFGQYGRVAKILISKRTSSHKFGNGHEPSIGVYVTYQNKEDAARAIVAIDGSKEPGGRIIRASYGTTKYCTAYLRNLPCSNPGCTYLHEPGEEADSFTKEDLATLRHAAKDTEHKIKPASMHLNPITKKVQAETAAAAAAAAHAVENGEGSALPRTALWASGKPMAHVEARDVPAFPGLTAHKDSPKAKPATPAKPSAKPRATDSPRPAPKKEKARKEDVEAQADDATAATPVRSPKPAAASTAADASGGSSYKPSANAQQLLDDLHARRQDGREQPSVFPDFDWTLATLHEGDFSFHLPELSEASPSPPSTARSSSLGSLGTMFAHDMHGDDGDAAGYIPYKGAFNPFDAELDVRDDARTERMNADALWRLQQQQQSAHAAMQEATELDARAKHARADGLAGAPRGDSQSLLVLLRRIQEQPDERPPSSPRAEHRRGARRAAARAGCRGADAGRDVTRREYTPTPPPPGLVPGGMSPAMPHAQAAQQPNRATGLLLAQLLGTHGAKTPELAGTPSST